MNTIANYINAFSTHRQTPQLVCEDGFAMSVQVGDCLYCSPRKDFEDARNYYQMEVGFPTQSESLLLEYAEDLETPTKSVYGYVPVEVINKVIAKHGGLKKPY
jgi:hypothetical protein